MAKTQEINYRYALDFLSRLNTVSIAGKKVSDLTVMGRYNIWHTYQQLLFSDIKVFSQYQTEDFVRRYKISLRRRIITIIRQGVFGGLALLVSLFGVIRWRIRAPKVLLFSVDKVSSRRYQADRRIEPVYHFLSDYGLSFHECFHTILSKTFLSSFWKRKRMAWYLEAVDVLSSLGQFLRLIRQYDTQVVDEFPLAEFAPFERPFARFLLKKYLRRIPTFTFRVRLFSALFRLHRPLLLFSIDDVRYYHELILACQNVQIPTYALQHGHFTKYQVGWLTTSSFSSEIIHPDRLIVWSEYWKNELLRLDTYFRPEQIIVGGALVPLGASIPTPSGLDDSISILIPYENDAPKKEVVDYIAAILSFPNTTIYFKLRPDVSANKQLEDYGLTLQFHERFIVVTEIKDYLEKIDLVAGTYSTLLYDMMAYGKPIALLHTSLDYGEGMALNGLADRVERGDTLWSQLTTIKHTPAAVIQERTQKLFDAIPRSLSQTLRQIAIQHRLIP